MSRAIFLFVLATVLAFGVVVASVGHGRTRHGLPRFPSFLRVRQEGPGFIR